MSALDRILSKVRIYGPFQCWVYTGAKKAPPRGGYGHAKVNGRTVRVHRYVYGELIQPPPPLLDHLCRVRSCFHPNHLQDSTVQENTKKGLAGLPKRRCTR